MDFEKYKTSCKGKSPIITYNKNEFLDIQKHINVLVTTLKKCAFDMTKFASIFPKGKIKGNTLLMHHTHIHTHINTSMHSCMEKYTLVHIVAAKAI